MATPGSVSVNSGALSPTTSVSVRSRILPRLYGTHARATGASATNEGTPVTPSADIAVDAAHHTITFTVPATALGGLHSLSGATLYLSTWDYDGGFRALAPSARSGSFGGGDGATDPLVMDDAGPILLD